MKNITRAAMTLRKNKNKASPTRKTRVNIVLKNKKKEELTLMSMIVRTGTAGHGVPYNEKTLDVKHMDAPAQRNLLNLLRSGRDTDGKRRRVDGVKVLPHGKGIIPDSYTPGLDRNLVLI